MTVKRHPVTVSASPGALVSEELRKPYFAFDESWLKALTASRPSKLSIVRVEGDSMAPTLNADDEVLVDLGDCEGRLGDGIYGAQSNRQKGDRAVRQFRLSRLARLQLRPDQLHRAGDLGRPADRLAPV